MIDMFYLYLEMLLVTYDDGHFVQYSAQIDDILILPDR